MDAALPLPEFTQRLLAAFEPTLEELRYAVTLRPNFSVVNSSYLDSDLDGSRISCIGLAGERTVGEWAETRLSLTAILVRLSDSAETTLQYSVGWFRSAGLGGLDDLSIYELRPPRLRIGNLSDLTQAGRYFPELKATYLRALNRGTPPAPSRWI